jgi:hypothetical protein
MITIIDIKNKPHTHKIKVKNLPRGVLGNTSP